MATTLKAKTTLRAVTTLPRPRSRNSRHNPSLTTSSTSNRSSSTTRPSCGSRSGRLRLPRRTTPPQPLGGPCRMRRRIACGDALGMFGVFPTPPRLPGGMGLGWGWEGCSNAAVRLFPWLLVSCGLFFANPFLFSIPAHRCGLPSSSIADTIVCGWGPPSPPARCPIFLRCSFWGFLWYEVVPSSTANLLLVEVFYPAFSSLQFLPSFPSAFLSGFAAISSVGETALSYCPGLLFDPPPKCVCVALAERFLCRY
eukprot:RCo013346